MNDIERLLAIEEIKQLKAKYFYYFDHQNWERWKAEVWAPDAELHVPESRAEPYKGVDTLIAWAREMAADQVSVHHGHMPIIEITSPTTATGIWAMEDRLYRSKENPLHGDVVYLHGFGHYRETYVKGPDGWRIKTTQLTRLRVEAVQVY
jgi:hypothetical protein